MPIPLEAELESFRASSAAFLPPQSSSLRKDKHPARPDRPCLFDSERFKRKFVLRNKDALKAFRSIRLMPRPSPIIAGPRRRKDGRGKETFLTWTDFGTGGRSLVGEKPRTCQAGPHYAC